MGPQIATHDLAALRRRWRRWTALVERYAQHHGGGGVDPDEYQVLHHELVAACRALAAADGTKRAFFRGLEELARPWLTVRVLEHTDHEILLDLLAHCRLAEQELHARAWFRPDRRWAAALAVLCAVAVLVVVLTWVPDRTWLPAREWLRGQWHLRWLYTQHTRDPRWWFLPGAVATLVAIVVVWRSGRNVTK